MIAELQEMVGEGALKIFAETALPLSVDALTSVTGQNPTDVQTCSAAEKFLTAENDSLRLLLEQASIDAKVLLAQAGIDAEEREAADKLQKLILDELSYKSECIAKRSMGCLVHGGHNVENAPVRASSIPRMSAFHSINPAQSGPTSMPGHGLHHPNWYQAPKLVLWDGNDRLRCDCHIPI